jgi:hypothetical protein
LLVNSAEIQRFSPLLASTSIIKVDDKYVMVEMLLSAVPFGDVKYSLYECRCDERLRGKAEGSTRLAYTGLCGGLYSLEHRKIETRLKRREV